MEKVTLHQAFEWTCNNCGRGNFTSAIQADLSEEDINEMLHLTPEQATEHKDGVWVTIPVKVQCGHCKAEFETETDYD